MKIIMNLLILMLSVSVSGQSVEGYIKNKNKEAVMDAIVYTGSLKNHTHSNLDGYFKLGGLASGDTLNIQYLGYKKHQYILADTDFENVIAIILEEADFLLDQVYIDNSLKSFNTVSNIDLKKNPVNSSQEILQQVPGLFIAQHAGGGKAEQIFLRGFDIDHGTDIALTVDGMPVNMVSHAHGQGYSDLHFVIPETIANIDFGKGPYYADKGNLNTAGYVDFKTKSSLDGSLVSMEAGRFNSFRMLAMLDLISQENDNLYLASEFISSDGPFESPQNFRRTNVMGKYKHNYSSSDFLEFQLSHFTSNWDASGQIPQRLVDNGTITRFGAVDDTEGGNTSRTNATLSITNDLGQETYNKLNLYYSHYDFRLWSNFTFFLEDPENGDQIRQSEGRHIIGIQDKVFTKLYLGDREIEFSAGAGLRYDDINDSELSHTRNRTEILERMIYGDINETNIFAFVNPSISFGYFTFNPSIRVDYFNFNYVNQLSINYDSQATSRSIISPKINLFYNPNLSWQLYLKSGIGFHSNDTRVILLENAEEILPAAYSVDLGSIWKPIPSMWINMAGWYLELDQEFVYVGDAGIVEPSGQSRRYGIDLGLRYQYNQHWYINTDLNYTIARSVGEPEGQNFIPLAPDLTALAGIYYDSGKKLSAGLRTRYIKDRPANEDNSIHAQGFIVSDLNLNYAISHQFSMGIAVDNLFNTAWNEAQFATLSRLADEAAPVEEIHFTPGVPFFAKVQLSLRW